RWWPPPRTRARARSSRTAEAPEASPGSDRRRSGRSTAARSASYWAGRPRPPTREGPPKRARDTQRWARTQPWPPNVTPLTDTHHETRDPSFEPSQRRWRRVQLRGGDRGPTEAYAAYAAGRSRGRQRSRWALIRRLSSRAPFRDVASPERSPAPSTGSKSRTAS